jgi:hypothetical protein
MNLQLTNSDQPAFVDEEDYERCRTLRWFRESHENEKYRYIRSVKSGVRLHRFIMGEPLGMVVDHKNHNPSDNRRENLRVATIPQNVRNANGRKKRKYSRFKGVTFVPKANKWKAQIMFQRKCIYLGAFTDEEKAALAYERAAEKYFQEFAYKSPL